jgi:hypothetical protein
VEAYLPGSIPSTAMIVIIIMKEKSSNGSKVLAEWLVIG